MEPDRCRARGFWVVSQSAPVVRQSAHTQLPSPQSSWLLWMDEERTAGTGRGMALLTAQPCHLEPSSPAPRWSFREPCRCSLYGAEVPLWMCECSEPGSWLAPCFLPKLFRLLPTSLSRFNVLLSSQFFIPNLPRVLKISSDSPHTHWTRQCNSSLLPCLQRSSQSLVPAPSEEGFWEEGAGYVI